MSAGQVLLTPSHVSAGSQTSPEPARHVVPFGFTRSGGQFGPVPVQVSVRSQASPVEAARHSAMLGMKVSAGQAPVDPSQTSATSQTPAAVRHTAPNVRTVQRLVQHEVANPLAAPVSHCSPPLMTPLPHCDRDSERPGAVVAVRPDGAAPGRVVVGVDAVHRAAAAVVDVVVAEQDRGVLAARGAAADEARAAGIGEGVDVECDGHRERAVAGAADHDRVSTRAADRAERLRYRCWRRCCSPSAGRVRN